ncbi:MAG: dihydrolipoyl dehydrogenase [Asgard group archaeon]|nr:dihydrolipoyl dehydrogenase [Asgard group archaeon]
MKQYDLIAIGTGSAMNVVTAALNENPDLRVAVIDKDEPGGICLTKGCIPTKILIYPADVIRIIERSNIFGIQTEIKDIDFMQVMKRMREIIDEDINNIREGLTNAEELDYYQDVAEFIAPYTLKIGNQKIKGKTILLCTGSKPLIPPIEGLDKIDYHTSDSILHVTMLPKRLCIVGGGYIAAEFGHFFSTMGSKVTIIGRNKYLVPQEEPEVSNLAKEKMSKYMDIHVNCEVIKIEEKNGEKIIHARNTETNESTTVSCDEILIATGRSPNTDILNPEKSGVETDDKGWIKVDDRLETSKENIWAFGDANGKHLFKHVANYESLIVYYNAILEKTAKVNYHAIPHAVFSHPEIASVGMTELEAIEKYGKAKILIGFQRYQDTAKGIAMDLKDYFVKIIIEQKDMRILGAHIIGPQASVLIQEIINLMYTPQQSIIPLRYGMHIHPALNEVVERAAGNLMRVPDYHHYLKHMGLSRE